ncbi:hypothetical protein WJ0W_006670 [Paenibacillus melissococcoides]|uniref:Uncharacterized protein n=1 Tax=Paenibacillus melissococcoides TaxID=2912268 RepID=A0ABN8UE46_9BACL|nr:hypothetical protein WJ0W_006670 [Paenibacillus melissococcoides]
MNKKQLKRIEGTLSDFETTKYMIQGEPTLDVPVSNCPGEIGVLCTTIQVLPDKKKEEPLTSTLAPIVEHAPAPSNPNEGEDAAAAHPFDPKKSYEEIAATNEVSEAPRLIPLELIVIPEAFLHKTPRREKVLDKLQFIQNTGKLDQPIRLEAGTHTLKKRRVYTLYCSQRIKSGLRRGYLRLTGYKQ